MSSEQKNNKPIKPAKKDDRSLTSRPKGEPMVWFTGMGLTVGLVMVIALLGLIVWQGLTVFWPKEVSMITLKEGAASSIRGQQFLGGEIKRVQEKKLSVAPGEDKAVEWQIFTGNKDAYGFSYKYIDADEIVESSQPEDVIMIERLEHGNALGKMLSLEKPDGTVVLYGSAEFENELNSAYQSTLAKRKEILKIEKGEIGDNSAELQKMEIEERGMKRREQWNDEVAAQFEQRRAELQANYDELNAKRLALQAEARKGKMTIQLFTGEERDVPFSELVYYYYPNQLGVMGRTQVFLREIWAFVSTEPREANMEGGVFPAIFGTFAMTILLSAFVTPFGVVAAIYLREYAKQGIFVRSVRIAVNNLAGVPSIVFGVFGLGFFVYVMGGSIDDLFFKDSLPTPTFKTGGILWASLTLALMTVPVVIVATEEALAAVPRGMREASLAAGASKWQTIQRIVLPGSSSGILTGLILAMARGAGEVAPLMLVGVVKLAPTLPVDMDAPFVHLDRKFMHLGFHIFDLGFQSPDSDAAVPMVFATTLLLIIIVVLLNLTAIMIRERLRRKYAGSSF